MLDSAPIICANLDKKGTFELFTNQAAYLARNGIKNNYHISEPLFHNAPLYAPQFSFPQGQGYPFETENLQRDHKIKFYVCTNSHQPDPASYLPNGHNSNFDP